MDMWVLITRQGGVLLEDKKTLTLTEMEGVCYSSVPPTNWPVCIMNTFFQHKGIHKYTWYRDLVGQCSIIDFCIVSADLFSSVIDVHVKRAAELSTNHHLVVCILRSLNHLRTRKQFKAKSIQNKVELLAD